MQGRIASDHQWRGDRGMPSRVTNRLFAARRRQFVGREGERNVFQTALDSDELPWQVLYIFGPGGVGKTTLLDEFSAITEDKHHRSIYIDGRTIEPSPEHFLAALINALQVGANESPFAALAQLSAH